MNLKSLLTVVLIIMGIYIIVQAILLTPQILSASFYYFKNASNADSFYYLFTSIFTIILYFLSGWFFISKTDKITSMIIKPNQLDADFSSFKIHRSTVLTIAIILIGGLTLINEIPQLILHVYNYRLELSVNPDAKFDQVILSIIKIVLGFSLLYYNRRAVSWIESQNRKNKEKEID